jgi:hypothetical protein
MTRLPDVSFFLFGMGGRRKVLYKAGALLDLTTGEVIRQWDVRGERIEPAAYAVHLETTAGKRVSIFEDEEACWLETEGGREALSRGHVNLPTFARHPRCPGRVPAKGGRGERLPHAFGVTGRQAAATGAEPPPAGRAPGGRQAAGHPYAEVLRVLHQEMLVNIRVPGREGWAPALRAGAPLPNLIVYDKPWYRDAAMVCMCLEKTGNLHLVRDWILGLREPFDRNNAGTCEPDNLGQALYLVSLVAAPASGHPSHPLVERILAEVQAFRQGDYIVGSTDSGEHPVYQTKWLKYGLKALRLPDPFRVPPVFDSYAALFWMDFKEQGTPSLLACWRLTRRSARRPAGNPRTGGQENRRFPRFKQMSRERYPYLGWAEDHFHGDPPGAIGGGLPYPLTWEAYASEARYERMAVVSEEYVRLRLAAPHTWHAAEMFLRLLGCPPGARPRRLGARFAGRRE